jgi:hypothetical protein
MAIEALFMTASLYLLRACSLDSRETNSACGRFAGSRACEQC